MRAKRRRPTPWPDPRDSGAGGGRAAADAGNTRRCLVSRETLPRERLVRFVVGPEREIVPDVAGRLPGRGLWLQSRRDIVERAVAANAFARAARGPVAVPDGLADRVESLLAARCIDLIGFARRAGGALAGFEAVRRALERGGAALLLVAADGSVRQRGRLPLPRTGGRIVDVLAAAELGSAFGRGAVTYAALGPGRIGERVRTEAARLAGFRAAQKSRGS